MDDDRRVVVVGSGPPGATAALFLCRAGIDVTLLEAGSARSSLGLTVRVAGFTVAKWRRPLRLRKDGISMTADEGAEYYEELAAGGLSNHWSCAVPRFSPEDFEDAARAGEEQAWPIGYDDLSPWYERVEPLLHISAGSRDTARVPAGIVRHEWKLGKDWEGVRIEAERRGRSVLPLPYVYGSDTTLTLSGTVFNSYVRLVTLAKKTKRLKVVHDAHVLRLETAPGEPRVTSVLYLDRKTGLERRARCRAVVLAAGAVNTTRILLESTSDRFPDGLGNADAVLGRYLHDHPVGKLVVDLGRPVSVHPPAYVARPALDRAEPLYAAACAQWTGTNIVAKSVLGGHPGKLPWIGFSIFGTMAPDRQNSVALDDVRRDGDGRKGIALNIRHPPESKSLLDQTSNELLEVLESAGLSPRSRVWKIESPGSANHYGGTCRMHASPRYGMLDAWNRLHRVPNVVVADSAAFTTGPEKNPVLTAMALSARASDRLAADLRNGSL